MFSVEEILAKMAEKITIFVNFATSTEILVSRF